jgi:hypothetical protein
MSRLISGRRAGGYEGAEGRAEDPFPMVLLHFQIHGPVSAGVAGWAVENPTGL